MKSSLLLALTLSLLTAIPVQAQNPNYNMELAQELGADELGMKFYVLAILKTGSNQNADPETVQKSFAGHLENINRLAEENKLIVAGPLMPNEDNFRGIFILNVATLEEAVELLQSDPAIRENLLAPDLYQWYGSAALSKYLEAADQIWQQKP
ncbi:MAG: hypothetical protein EA360_07300 [Balneolaceae bacterium]|nr:MAG: hypothetical protein EA360_07300 [Balneolaceae bacterium]